MLLPEHVVSAPADKEVAGWLIDLFGRAHAVLSGRTVVGRVSDRDLAVFHESVSREHAVIEKTEDGWQVRDVGSKNGTVVEGKRVEGRAMLSSGARVQFGRVAFFFVDTPGAPPAAVLRSMVTADAGEDAPRRCGLEDPNDGTQIWLIGTVGDDGKPTDAPGIASVRPPDADAWRDLPLTPMEFQLLYVLGRARKANDGPSRKRGCVPTKQLARDLPFQSSYANEENVRQLVKRLRASLRKAGIEGLVDAIPRRGYYVTWQVLHRSDPPEGPA